MVRITSTTRNDLIYRRAPLRHIFIAATTALLLLFLPFHLAFAGSVQVLAPVTTADGRLGLDDVLPGTPVGTAGSTWGQLAYNAGARIDRWEFRWDQIEPAAGQYNFAASDAEVQAAQQAGLQVEGILIGTPKWAVAPGQRPGNGAPSGLSYVYTDPRNIWAEYVRATVSEYRGQVQAWEVWNEPDTSFFWSAGPDVYYRMLKIAYQVIKSVDPTATVLMAGMIVPSLAFPARVLTDIEGDRTAADHGDYFDAVAWHAYGPARALYTNLMNFRALLTARGLSATPIWVTEDGFPASNPNGEPRQAAYVLQTVAYAFAAGASKVLVYRASDDTTKKAWGLMAADGTPRLGYVSFQLAAQYFAGTLAATYEPGTQVEQFSFYRPGQRIILLCNRGIQPASVTLTADSPEATLVDSTGNTTSVTAVNGQYTLSLPGAAYNAGIDPAGAVVGGPPVLLVEGTLALPGVREQQYVPPVTGTQRRLALFNPNSSTSTVRLSANAEPYAAETLQVPGQTIRTVDLDLLAGSQYAGFYNLMSSSALAASAWSGNETGTVQTVATGGISGAKTWYVPGGTALTIANTAGKPVTVTLTAFGGKGVQRSAQRWNVLAASHITWIASSWLRAIPHAVTVKATGPVAVSGAYTTPLATPRPTWYSVQPGNTPLSVYNPSPSATSRLTIRFVGAPTAVPGRQIRLPAHHSVLLTAHGARAVVVAASRPVAASTVGTTATTPLVSQPRTNTALPSVGPVTQFLTYNPASRPAHVTFSTVGGPPHLQRNIVLQPGQTGTFQARAASQPPRGVLGHSDVPVVITPAE